MSQKIMTYLLEKSSSRASGRLKLTNFHRSYSLSLWVLNKHLTFWPMPAIRLLQQGQITILCHFAHVIIPTLRVQTIHWQDLITAATLMISKRGHLEAEICAEDSLPMMVKYATLSKRVVRTCYRVVEGWARASTIVHQTLVASHKQSHFPYCHNRMIDYLSNNSHPHGVTFISSNRSNGGISMIPRPPMTIYSHHIYLHILCSLYQAHGKNRSGAQHHHER